MTNFFEVIQVLREVANSQINPNDFDQCLITGPSYETKQKRRKIKKAILTINLNKTVLIEALKNKVDLILLYDFENLEKINLIDENLEKYKHIIENNILVYKIPDSWTYSKGGLNETLAEILKLEIEGVFQIRIGDTFQPYGRICSPFKSKIRYSLLLNLISDKLGLKGFQYLLVNETDDIVKRSILLVGKKAQPNWLKRAKMNDIDLFLGNGLDFSLASFAESLEINFIDLTYNSIFIGLSRLSKVLALKCPDVEFIDIESSLPLFFFSRQPST